MQRMQRLAWGLGIGVCWLAAGCAGGMQPGAALSGGSIALLAAYCTLIVLASLFGGWMANRVRLDHTRTQLLLSAVGGFMLGIGVFHLLPHSIHLTGSATTSTGWMMTGLLTMFFLIRAFHFHHHGPAAHAEPDGSGARSQESGGRGQGAEVRSQRSGHTESNAAAVHKADHQTDHNEAHGHGHGHRLSWLGVTLGLGLHTLIDGITLGADVAAQVGAPTRWPLYGFGTFLAILLHKPLDAVSITSLMATGGWSATWRNAVNAGFALMCPLGAVIFLLGVRFLAGEQALFVGCALGFSAGVFLCISLGDLLPELEMHSHHRLQLSAALLLGVGLAWLIEQAHQEGHAHAPLVNKPAAGATLEP